MSFFFTKEWKKQALELSWAITIIIEYSNRTYIISISFFRFLETKRNIDWYFNVRYVIWLYMVGVKKYITNYS